MVRANLVGMTESIDGVLAGKTRDFWLLSHARIVQTDGDTLELTGEVRIPRDRLLFFQTL